MEILGIGPLELFFILVIALIILGPKDMAKAGRTIGRFMRKIITSPEWRTVQKASREIKYLPNRLMRDASLEDLSKDFDEVNQIGRQLNADVKQVGADLSSWTTPPTNPQNEGTILEHNPPVKPEPSGQATSPETPQPSVDSAPPETPQPSTESAPPELPEPPQTSQTSGSE
jgi:sec-independent protein translocase protein TatB